MRGVRLPDDVKERVLAMARAGKRPKFIHRELDGAITLPYIYKLVSDARRGGALIPRHGGGRHARRIIVTVSDRAHEALAAAAARRKLAPEALAEFLIEASCNDDLIDAVLDDGGGA